jgi:hypothetical protein
MNWEDLMMVTYLSASVCIQELEEIIHLNDLYSYTGPFV